MGTEPAERAVTTAPARNTVGVETTVPGSTGGAQPERSSIEPKWWHVVPFALVVLAVISLIAGIVTAPLGRMILQIAVVVLVLSWLAMWMWSRRDREGRMRLRLPRNPTI